MQRLAAELQDLKNKGLLRSLRHFHRTVAEAFHLQASSHPSTQLHLLDQPLTNFAANDYLGLVTHPAIAAAFTAAIATHGTGSGASRLVSGGSPIFAELEQTIAASKKTAAALTFSSGYAAALGTIPALVGSRDFIILDKLSHACLIDGSKLSGATLRSFPHNNVEKLEHILAKIRATQPADTRILVITESVFSMDGDVCPLAEIIACKDRHQATLMLDEAHGLGVLGPHGGGLAEQLNLLHAVDIHMGTLSKAAGLAGGYIAAAQPIIDLLINRARSFIYSTAPPPALIAASHKALEIIHGPIGHAARIQLHANIAHFCDHMEIPHSPSPIIPIILGENNRALSIAAALQDTGFLVPAIRYPTVPPNTARLRISLSAAHTTAQLTALARTLRALLH